MDPILYYADEYVLDKVYPEALPRDDMFRQYASLFVLTGLGALTMYLGFAFANYTWLFDKRLLKHPMFLKEQIKLELECALHAMPWMAGPTVAVFTAEARGHSLLYDDWREHGGLPFMAASFVAFFLFTDCCIYWIHRWLHHPVLYAPLHKLHHKWKVPSPFASHAFHPMDGFLQSVPYHVYPFLFPLHKGLYLGLFTFVNIWTVSIHDGDYRVPKCLQAIINGSAHHSDHHLKFTCNYGEYLTLWDRIGGSFHNPLHYQGKGIHDQLASHLAKTKTGGKAKDATTDSGHESAELSA